MSSSNEGTCHDVCITRRVVTAFKCLLCRANMAKPLALWLCTKIPMWVWAKTPIPYALDSWELPKWRLRLVSVLSARVWFSSPCWPVSSKSSDLSLFSPRGISMALLPGTRLAASLELYLKYCDPGAVSAHHGLVRITHQVSAMIYQSHFCACNTFWIYFSMACFFPVK